MMIEDKIDKYLEEACDGSGSGPKDGTGMKKQKKKRKGQMEEASVSVQKQQGLAMQWKKSGLIMKLNAISEWAKEAVNYANFGDPNTVKANLKRIEQTIVKINKEL